MLRIVSSPIIFNPETQNICKFLKYFQIQFNRPMISHAYSEFVINAAAWSIQQRLCEEESTNLCEQVNGLPTFCRIGTYCMFKPHSLSPYFERIINTSSLTLPSQQASGYCIRLLFLCLVLRFSKQFNLFYVWMSPTSVGCGPTQLKRTINTRNEKLFKIMQQKNVPYYIYSCNASVNFRFRNFEAGSTIIEGFDIGRKIVYFGLAPMRNM